MKSVWKYSIEVTDVHTIDMPEGAKILCVQVQHGEPQLWALVDPQAPRKPRTIRIHGTGHPIHKDPGKYIGSFQLLRGNLVFHVFSDEE